MNEATSPGGDTICSEGGQSNKPHLTVPVFLYTTDNIFPFIIKNIGEYSQKADIRAEERIRLSVEQVSGN